MAVESNATELRTLPDVTLPNLMASPRRSLPSPRAVRALSSSRATTARTSNRWKVNWEQLPMHIPTSPG